MIDEVKIAIAHAFSVLTYKPEQQILKISGKKLRRAFSGSLVFLFIGGWCHSHMLFKRSVKDGF